MSERSVIVMGLPESGKTTYLAALWHIVIERDVDTALRFHTLATGDASHLNRIAARWREAKVQDRTELGGSRSVGINLLDQSGAALRVTFPDLPGEAYRRMWEDRDVDPDVGEMLKSGAVLLFVHADTIRPPQWIVDEVALARALGLEVPEGQEVPWHPRLAPTQVQLVELLQLMREAPLDIGPRRLAIMLSAWDKGSGEGLTPEVYVEQKLPLLHQYLQSAADDWTSRVYGLSAQGGDYDSLDPSAPRKAEAETLRSLDQPSERIRLLFKATETRDLTEPLAWLMALGSNN